MPRMKTPPDMLGDITRFHQRYNLNYNGPPRPLPDMLQDFRSMLLEEEMKEYHDGVAVDDLEEQFDALIDLVYVALGTAYLNGFDFAEGWRRVHHANMQKVRAADSTESQRGGSFDVIKPEGWVPPDLSDLVTS